jgi:hypothetical protein
VTEYGCHAAELADFDARVRACFEGFSGLHPNATQWRRAVLAVRNGGVGLRRVADHAAAAWLASRSATHARCAAIDPDHLWEVDQPASASAAAVRALNAVLPEPGRITPSVPTPIGQRELSQALEEVEAAALLAPSGGLDARARAHLRLVRQPGAGAWLTAMPSFAIGNAIAAPLFVTLLRRRLGMPVFEESFFCPRCAGVMDPFGDHALVCAGGGDRTLRHNALRDIFAHHAQAAGYAAAVEKSGLLPPRPFLGGAWDDGTVGADARSPPESRRPADVFLPAWRGGRGAAVDFAVTSGLQCGLLDLSAADGGVAATRYEERKRSHLRTAQLCDEAGLHFLPFVVEADGGFGSDACATLSALARAAARLTGEAPSVRGAYVKQSLSIALQRANALAIARRAPGVAPPLAAPLAAARAQLAFAAAAGPPPPLPPNAAAGAAGADATPAACLRSRASACAQSCASPPTVMLSASASSASSPLPASRSSPPPAAAVPCAAVAAAAASPAVLLCC